MMTLVELIAVYRTTKDVAAPVLQRLRDAKLSNEERAMLIAAAVDGNCYVFDNTQAAGTIFGIGSAHFPEQTDSDDLAEFILYEEAFASLIRHGYVKHVADALFHLTTAGFDRARGLAIDV